MKKTIFWGFLPVTPVFCSPTKHATLGNIRSYLRRMNKITVQEKKDLTEETCVNVWNQHFGEAEVSESETESEF